MRPRPVALYLTPFDALRESEPQDGDIVVDEGGAGEVAREEALAENHSVLLQRAREDAYSEGIAAGGRAIEQELENQKCAFAARVEDARAQWAQQEGAQLAEALGAALAEIEAAIGSRVARVLRPFMRTALRDRAVAELEDAVGLILRGRDQPLIEISGAPDLIAALQSRLESRPDGVIAAIGWTPNSSSDVRVVANQTVIQSRIEAWMRRIEAEAGES